jgi:hypothetical protein
VTAADAAGTATTGAINGAFGMGLTAFRTKVVLTVAMARGRTIRPPFGAAPLNHGVGVGGILIKRHRRTFGADDPERTHRFCARSQRPPPKAS